MAKKINITAQLNAATTDGILASATQIYDEQAGKFQKEINAELKEGLEEAITSEETDMVVESIEEGIVHNALRKTEQILTEAEKGQARENIGAVSEQTFENEAVRVKKQVFTSEQKYQARHNISAITAEEAGKIAQDKFNENAVSSPDKLQAVKELSSWLEENPDNAATMNAAIQENAADIQRLYRGTGIDEYSQFSTGMDYSAGDVVLYDGVLFRFKVEHAKGAWDYNEVEEWSEKKEREEKLTELGSEVTQLVKSTIDKMQEDILGAEYENGKVIKNKYVGIESDTGLLSNAEGEYMVFVKHVIPNEKIIIYTDKLYSGGDSLAAFTDSNNPLENAKKIPVGGKNNIALNVGYNEISVPESAKYIAVTLQFEDRLGLPENKIVATYSEYAIIQQIKELEDVNKKRYNELQKSKVGKKSINLFDSSREQLVGKYVGSDGKLSSAEGCIASYLIPIKPNTLYSWNTKKFNNNHARFVASDGVTGLHLLNESGEELPYTGNNSGVIKSPSNAAYFQFTIDFLGRENISNSACLIESDIFVEDYYEYSEFLDINELPNEYRDLPQRVSSLEKGDGSNPLFGKTIYFCGDSIMNGILVDANRRLYNQIADRYGMIANNKSLDGSVIFYPMTNNKESIYWQLTQIPTDADYIIIQGGVNGMNMSDSSSTPYFPMGEITDSYKSEFDLSTQIGCLEGICKYLYDNFSGKKFGFIITYQITSTYESYLNYWEKKADAFVKVLKKWGIPYIDWRQSGVNLAANSQKYGFSVLDYEEFSESKDYNLDDKVRYNNIGYKAKVAIAAGKPFDASQWQQLSTKAEEHDTWHCNAIAYDLLSYQTGKWVETL